MDMKGFLILGLALAVGYWLGTKYPGVFSAAVGA